jgi:antitoxin CcdA
MRMAMETSAKSAKKAVNLTVDATLLEAARAGNVNISALLEKALEADAKHRWLVDNSQAIEAFNEEVLAHGAWSDGIRSW